jgi:hypothetical protein
VSVDELGVRVGAEHDSGPAAEHVVAAARGAVDACVKEPALVAGRDQLADSVG